MEPRMCRSHLATTVASSISTRTRWTAASNGRSGWERRGAAGSGAAPRFFFVLARLQHDGAGDRAARNIVQHGLHSRRIDPLCRLESIDADRLERVEIFEALIVEINEDGLTQHYSAPDGASCTGTKPVWPKTAYQLVRVRRARRIDLGACDLVGRSARRGADRARRCARGNGHEH